MTDPPAAGARPPERQTSGSSGTPPTADPAGPTGDTQIVDEEHGVVLRRVVVGPLDTNCWIVHPVGGTDALIVDPGDEPDRIVAATAGLDPIAVLLTHHHFDHVDALPELSARLSLPRPLSHPAEAPVWPSELDDLRRHGHWDAGTATAALLATGTALHPRPGRELWDGRCTPVGHRHTIELGPLVVEVLHTPGHTPGSVSVALPGHLLTGDTLFPGGPGLTGPKWPLTSFDTIMDSVRRLVATTPGGTAVHPGHGPSTTIAAERPHLDRWQQRGW